MHPKVAPGEQVHVRAGAFLLGRLHDPSDGNISGRDSRDPHADSDVGPTTRPELAEIRSTRDLALVGKGQLVAEEQLPNRNVMALSSRMGRAADMKRTLAMSPGECSRSATL